MSTAFHPSNRQKEVAQLTAAAFQIDRPSITRFYDEQRVSDIGILVAPNSPEDGITSYATIGLSDHPLMRGGKEFSSRVEMLGLCDSAVQGFDNIISTLAFCVIKSKWFCAPGIIFPDVISMYKISETMSSVYFASPFAWGNRFSSAEVDGLRVAWLMAIPISDAESKLAQTLGSAELEKLLIDHKIDVADINRNSVI
ncbi:suppressor of fused domain protein [Xanthomonas oryzae]|uniref:suppressor of fused domain protein n=1 Tax=Xanthomonas oryzae TaxID=347 RepID=UPI00103508B8|nr:suppressor of fused domain protein [Xanthomonas oryzae]QBH01546.1 suppressor of fused domain protein [Xanthomonas oryzae]